MHKKNSLLSVERNQAINYPHKGRPLLRSYKVYRNWGIPARKKRRSVNQWKKKIC